MKLRPPSMYLPFHRPLRFGRRWRNHELLLRVIQLTLLVVLSAIAARLIADGVAMAFRAIAGVVS